MSGVQHLQVQPDQAGMRLDRWFRSLFPHISHIHYTKIGEIVKRTAREFNLPYNEYKTTRSALYSHFKFLKQLGVQPS